MRIKALGVLSGQLLLEPAPKVARRQDVSSRGSVPMRAPAYELHNQIAGARAKGSDILARARVVQCLANWGRQAERRFPLRSNPGARGNRRAVSRQGESLMEDTGAGRSGGGRDEELAQVK